MSTKEVVNTAELHVYERPLYSVGLTILLPPWSEGTCIEISWTL